MSDAQTYLRELRRALPRGYRRRFLTELREHFASAAEIEAERGLGQAEAERLTIARLGPAQALADQLVGDLRSGALGPAGRLAVALTATRLVALATVTAIAVVVGVALVSSRSSAAPPTIERAAVSNALREVGTPYAWGKASPAAGFDSSGLVVWAYTSAGARRLPHNARGLWQQGSPVTRQDLKPGDLVFFDDRELVGIYVGDDRFVDAEHSGSTVGIRRLGTQTMQHYDGAIRPSL